jgi:tripartite-type tricarboxylate transporter receptor subunit TctC
MPGKLKVASGGVGTTGHLSAALFDLMAGTQMVHVPYRSGAEAFKDMVNGDVDLLFENVALSQMLASGGKVKMMAVTSRTRVPTLPNVPSLDESGLKGYEVMAWAGFLVPKGTPQDIVARMNTAMRAAVADPEVRKATESFALIAMPGSPREFQALIDAETPKWVDLVKRTGAKVD